ncbi:MAG: ATP-binding cassette domain-containing protein [Burkholderiales bacterium]|nr:ATP-binding cassette domain-containing protein [Burkholderiales bacterium]
MSKAFGEVRAVDGVDLEIRGGEVTALLGENGAGKSTLMKLLYGVYRPDAGTIEIDGRTVALTSPAAAISQGIGMVFQQFTLLPALSVLENLLLSWPRTRWILRRDQGGVLARLKALAPGLDPARRVADLAVGECQLVELVRVLNMDARCVILDEPTSVLTPMETERFYELVRPLARDGRAVVLITHKMADVAACADRVVVMRRGKVVDSSARAERTLDQLVHQMVGESQEADGVPSSAPAGTVAKLVVRKLSAGNAQEVDFELVAGEVFGIAGVAGNGQRALAEALAGVLKPRAGSANLLETSILWGGGRESIDPRVAYIPEQPRENAVAAALPITINLALRRLRGMPAFPDWAYESGAARALLKRFDVRPPDPTMSAEALSGGNLQKLVVARELSRSPEVVIACYPTMGLDVAATHAVHRHLVGFAEQGACVIWFSEDLDELVLFAHRIAVMRGGRIVGVLPRDQASRHELGRMMAGSMERAA